jgi:hypothetical protein
MRSSVLSSRQIVKGATWLNRGAFPSPHPAESFNPRKKKTRRKRGGKKVAGLL